VGSRRPDRFAPDRPRRWTITAKGRQIPVMLNGQKTAALHNGLFAEGAITLQHGDGVIKFRKVAIRPL
jgi:hypothetical protein